MGVFLWKKYMISTIKKFTSGRGWGITLRGLSYKAFNLPSHPDHKYYGLGVGISTWGICLKKCDRDPHPKPYIFMIRVTRQIKCIIA
jgi:hypothetical protein